MKKNILSILILSSVSSVAFAGCLDHIPQSRKELVREIRIAKSELANAQEMQSIFADIALSAKRRNELAQLVAAASTLPVSHMAGIALVTSFPAGVAIGWIASVGQLSGNIFAYSMVLAPTIASGSITVKSLRTAFKKEGLDDKAINSIVNEVNIAVRSCSYKEAFNELKYMQDQVFATDLDGSFKHELIDRVTLGSLSRRATEKLFKIAAYKTTLYEQKLGELKKLQK